jgi:muramoyltetrapeptide carboxypeptidase
MTIPEKLQIGDEIRIIAPARSMSIISQEIQDTASKRLKKLGLKVSYGKNIKENDLFSSSSIENRIEDFHTAFSDRKIKGILTVLGGFNSNQLLKYIDYSLIINNPKIFCGFSDITALANAIYSKTNLVTYSGLHFSSFGMLTGFEYSQKYFSRILFHNQNINLEPSQQWSDDVWFIDQENREFITNEGYWIINQGESQGTAIGGNLCTLQLLQGTEYMPKLKNAILFLEDDAYTDGCDDVEFDRNLQSLIHQNDFHEVKGIVIGRFQKKSNMTLKKLD